MQLIQLQLLCRSQIKLQINFEKNPQDQANTCAQVYLLFVKCLKVISPNLHLSYSKFFPVWDSETKYSFSCIYIHTILFC